MNKATSTSAVGRAEFLLSAGALGGALTLGLSPTAANADVQTVRVSMAGYTQMYSPFFVAIEKGYYTDEGLALDVKFVGGGVSMPAQLAGSLEFNTSAGAAPTLILRGAAMKVIYTVAQHPPYELWSTSKAIKSIKDLKGQQVGIISRGDTFEMSMKLVLQKAGLPLDYVSYTALGAQSNLGPAFVAGSLPAVIMSNLDVENVRQMGALNKGVLLFDMMKNLNAPAGGLVVTDAYLKDHRDTVRAFLRATLKGVRYMLKYKPQTLAFSAKHNPTPNPVTDAVDYDEVARSLSRDGTVSDDVLREETDVRASLLEIPKDQILPISRIYDFSLVREVNAALNKSGWQPQA